MNKNNAESRIMELPLRDLIPNDDAELMTTVDDLCEILNRNLHMAFTKKGRLKQRRSVGLTITELYLIMESAKSLGEFISNQALSLERILEDAEA